MKDIYIIVCTTNIKFAPKENHKAFPVFSMTGCMGCKRFYLFIGDETRFSVRKRYVGFADEGDGSFVEFYFETGFSSGIFRNSGKGAMPTL